MLHTILPDLKSRTSRAVVGITGRVAVGKSTFADRLAEVVSQSGCTTDVLNTDGYIYPTAELVIKNLLQCKGRFITHDVPWLLRDITTWRESGTSQVPIYNHARYDRLDITKKLLPTDILIVEGLLVAHPDIRHELDYLLFLETDPPELAYQWFLKRSLAIFPNQRERLENGWRNINEITYAAETILVRDFATSIVILDEKHEICQIIQP